MPQVPRPSGSFGPTPAIWQQLGQVITMMQGQIKALQQGARQTNLVDGYGNTWVVIGTENQTVTIGAGFMQAGVLVGTALGFTPPGIAMQVGLVTTTITTTATSTTATVGSATGLKVGMVIGAAKVAGTSAIVPGTTISHLSGTTVTLSQAAAASGSSLYCAACDFIDVASTIENISGMVNPMTTEGDMIVALDNLGTPGRLAAGSTSGDVLTSNGSGAIPSWQPGGMTNPMTTEGDIIYGGTSGTPERLGAGTAGYVLQTQGPGSPPQWDNIPQVTSFDWPPDQGFYGWSAPPEYMPATSAIGGNNEDLLVFVKASETGTVNYLYLWIEAAATGLVTDDNYLSIYEPVLTSGVTTSFSLLGASAAGVCDTAFASSGIRKVALSSGVSVVQGQIYYLGLRYNASHAPTLMYRNNFNTGPIAGLVYPYVVYAENGGTSPAGTITLSAGSSNTTIFWMAMGP